MDLLKELKKSAERKSESARLRRQVRRESGSPEKKKDAGRGKAETQEREDEGDGLIPYTLASRLIPVKNLRNGIIHTTDGRYVKIVEVLPVNFLLRSSREQREIIQSFFAWLKVAPCRFQVRTVAQKADIGRYVDRVREEMRREENGMCRKLQEDYISLLQDVGLKEAVSRRFFLIFEYDSTGGERDAQEADIRAALEDMADTVKRYLGRCGNGVAVPEEPTQFTAELLYRLLNRQSSMHVSFAERVNEVAAWYLKENGEESMGKIPITEYFPLWSLT